MCTQLFYDSCWRLLQAIMYILHVMDMYNVYYSVDVCVHYM